MYGKSTQWQSSCLNYSGYHHQCSSKKHCCRRHHGYHRHIKIASCLVAGHWIMTVPSKEEKYTGQIWTIADVAMLMVVVLFMRKKYKKNAR